MAVKVTTFQDFLRNKLDDLELSTHTFAELADVSQSTVVRATNYTREPSALDLLSLYKIARALNLSVCTLIGMIFPEETPRYDPKLLALAEEISKLPDDAREDIIDVLNTLVSKRRSRGT